MQVSFREITIDDVPDIISVQKEAYSELYWERDASFTSKIRSSKSCCFGAFLGPKMIGYAISFGVAAKSGDASVPLDCEHVESMVRIEEAQSLYVHDIAVRPSSSGLGIGAKLFHCVLEVAKTHRIEQLELVAVQGASSYWKDVHGFEECAIDCALSGSGGLGYGKEAVKMKKQVTA
jgi:hypothetical protein